MKINFENYPIAHAVKTKTFQQLKSYEACEVEFLTIPFYNIIAIHKLPMAELLPKLANHKGILLFSTSQLFYQVNNKDFQLIHYDGNQPLLKLHGTIKEKGACEYYEDETFFNRSLLQPDQIQKDNAYIYVYAGILFRYLCFKQFAELEIYRISTDKTHGYQAKRTIGSEQYQSEFRFPVKIIDSKYIRTLIRTGQFKVRGFFRLQPFGPGLSKVKLIWIAEHLRNKHNILKKDLRSESFSPIEGRTIQL